MSDAAPIASPADRRRWLILGVVSLAQLMVVLLHRRSAAAGTPAGPGQAQARHPRRGAGLRRPVLPGLRVLEPGHPRLAHAVHLRIPRRRGGAAGRLAAVAGPGGSPAAAAAYAAAPQPGRRLPHDARLRGRAVRGLLVLDLLPAAGGMARRGSPTIPDSARTGPLPYP